MRSIHHRHQASSLTALAAVVAAVASILAGCGGDVDDDGAIRVEAHCCGAAAAEVDAGVAIAVQVADDLPDDVPFVVGGVDRRQAEAVAARLTELGARQVRVVAR